MPTRCSTPPSRSRSTWRLRTDRSVRSWRKCKPSDRKSDRSRWHLKADQSPRVPDTSHPLDSRRSSLDRTARRSRYCTSVPAPDRPNADQRAAFARDGYLVVPGGVERNAIEAALQVANHWLDDGFDSAQRDTYHAQSFAPEHIADPEIIGLPTQTDGLEIAESLVGQSLVTPARAQITLRFPVARGQQPNAL